MNQPILQNNCISIGGIQKIWLATQSKGEEGIVQTTDDFVEFILDREQFQAVYLGKGNHGFTESLVEDNQGNSISANIVFELIRERKELLAFEKKFRKKVLMAVLLTNNNEQRIFRNLILTRTATSGQGYSGKNHFAYQLTGNASEEVATFAKSREAIFYFQTRKNGTLSANLVFSGTATWLFSDGKTATGNSFSQANFNGIEQTATIDSETSVNEVTEIHFRDCGLFGEFKLDLLTGLKKADLAFNEISSVNVGNWVNQQGVVIELRDNRLTTEEQEAFLIAISNKIAVDSSNLKIGLMNQTDGQGGHFLPNQNTIDLAKELYENFGVEVLLPPYRTTLDL